MKKLILIRHGESEWNKLNLFTGWTNVDLSEKGVQEAIEAGKTLKENGYRPEICFTSYLKRAIKTLNLALEAMDMDWLPVYKSWPPFLRILQSARLVFAFLSFLPNSDNNRIFARYLPR